MGIRPGFRFGPWSLPVRIVKQFFQMIDPPTDLPEGVQTDGGIVSHLLLESFLREKAGNNRLDRNRTAGMNAIGQDPWYTDEVASSEHVGTMTLLIAITSGEGDSAGTNTENSLDGRTFLDHDLTGREFNDVMINGTFRRECSAPFATIRIVDNTESFQWSMSGNDVDHINPGSV